MESRKLNARLSPELERYRPFAADTT